MWGEGGRRVFILSLALFLALQTPASAERKAYLIITKDVTSFPHPLLSPITNDFKVLYALDAIHGIVVEIDDVLAPRIQQLPGVMAVTPDTLLEHHTTHSWDFLGLGNNGLATPAWSSDGKFGENTIIGNIDSGVWPESESFRDDGLSDVPSRWRGTCDRGNDTTFRCNKKLIGARFFSKGIQLASSLPDAPKPSSEELSSPRDFEGHGTHTLSTAGGAFVRNASVLGRGKGRAAGGSPRARVAAYKACFAVGCSGVDVLAAIVAAVEDGVDVLSMSLGAPASDYLTDLIAIGTLYAVQKGVTVVASAGNSGPGPSTVSNVAPWMFTVGASTLDRNFPAYVNFGANVIEGQSVANSTLPLGQAYPIISGEQANAANESIANSTLCLPGSLDPAKVRGKIVVCIGGRGRAVKGEVVKHAGGVGMVLCNDATFGNGVLVDTHLIPAAHCSYSDCQKLFNYVRSPTNNPSGFITTTDVKLGIKPAPKMAAFSSRGPNPITPQILKPDITAPGVGIIAAYSGAISPSTLQSPFDDRRVLYNVLSGTSMSCPHVSGIAGLLKTKYPSWSPAMIKSAIMTTASTGANDGIPIRDQTSAAATPFSYGSGHVDPVKALDPGLVYDTTPADYAKFLCSLKLTQDPLKNLPVDLPLNLSLPLFEAAGNPYTCSRSSVLRPEDLNYPSITVPCLTGRSITVKRRVKNVGAKASSYSVTVEHPTGIKVAVNPNKLSLGVGEEKEFTVNLNVVNSAAAADYVFGSIEWSDGVHRVRSPVVVKTTCG